MFLFGQALGRAHRTALLVSFALPALAYAWGPEGHAIVGDIATQTLTPAAQRAVAQLLSDDLGVDGQASGRITLAQVSSWPDEIRALPAYRSAGVFHYDDIPICDTPDREKYCPSDQCASGQLKRQIALLKDRSAAPRERNEALKWIVHLIGDMHQPLHASNHDDKGGNDVKVRFFGTRMDEPRDGRAPRPLNLHAIWDTQIPHRMIEERGGYPAFLADVPDDASRRAWEAGGIDDWFTESNAIAKNFLYPDLPTSFMCAQPIEGVLDIGDAYFRAASPVVAVHLKKAGVRLAKVLNDALAEP